MATTRPSFTKRQRETAKRERQQLKAAKRAARKAAGDDGSSEFETIESADVESQVPPAEQ
ncbi:MAG TPA: hypothetical protein VKB93_09905 [Thermoanaerobaculia bacterium]|nr:hypothetical protein [Thermoanaerobaculia bacterium]